MTTVTVDADEIDDVIEALAPPQRSGMFLRPQPEQTLQELLETLPPRPASAGCGSHNIVVRLEDDNPTIVFGTHEVPVTKTGLEALGSYFEVPTKFLTRIEPDEQQFVLSRRIERAAESNLVVHWSSEGIIDIIKASSQRLEVADILESVTEVMPEGSLVVEWVNTPEMFFLDTVVPTDFDRFIGGDVKVGDISKGGLRFFQDRKRNLSPSVQPFIWRYACTNGMQVSDNSLKIDARGAEAHEILGKLRTLSREALDGVMHSITAFYDLRSQKIGDDRTGVLHRLVRENDLPTRTVVALEDALPGYLSADFGVSDANEATMFHLVNLITNAANNPDIAHSHGSRRRLESLGGDILNDHIARCGFCHSRLN